jgi:hypothetical protein
MIGHNKGIGKVVLKAMSHCPNEVKYFEINLILDIYAIDMNR